MCGFVGWAGRDASAGPIRLGVDAIAHRGPDAAGVTELGGPDGERGVRCVLGSVRLRIIDISPEGDQPMPNEDGSAWVSFNGELYNHPELRAWLDGRGHTFRSKTDTEALVHAYEEFADDPHRMLDRLRGMFAFGLWDSNRGRLFMARDRLGIKPLYYAQTSDGGVAFASEIRALARAGVITPSPDTDAIRGYLLRGVIPGPSSAFEGVRELPAGCYALWDGSGPPQVRRWWSLSMASDPAVAAAPVEALSEALEDAVARHLVADRPIGVFLSSGVDSGAIATVAAKRGTIRTFTVTFPDLGDDEGSAAADLARRIGASHEEVQVTATDVESWVRRGLADMDQPTHDGLNSWLVSRAAHEAGLVVALSGLGGDELFGGYGSFGFVPGCTDGAADSGSSPLACWMPRLARSRAVIPVDASLVCCRHLRGSSVPTERFAASSRRRRSPARSRPPGCRSKAWMCETR